eukprot:13688.XXX_727541_727678_1 [CDS] Oithona nana genome sequencing.
MSMPILKARELKLSSSFSIYKLNTWHELSLLKKCLKTGYHCAKKK